MRSRRWATSLLALVLCLAVAFGITPVRTAALRAAGHALVADDALIPPDVLVIPEWAGAASALEVADLVQSGIVKRVVVLAGPELPEEREFQRRGVAYEDFAAILARQMISLGVVNPERMPRPAPETEAEGREIADWCAGNHFRSIVGIHK